MMAFLQFHSSCIAIALLLYPRAVLAEMVDVPGERSPMPEIQ